MTAPRRGGRRKGQSGRRNDGLLKRCGCSRKRWSECPHPWWFNLATNHTSFRFNLNKRAGLSPKAPLARTEAERWRDHFRTLARNGEITRRGLPLKTAAASHTQARTLRQVADDFVERVEERPESSGASAVTVDQAFQRDLPDARRRSAARRPGTCGNQDSGH